WIADVEKVAAWHEASAVAAERPQVKLPERSFLPGLNANPLHLTPRVFRNPSSTDIEFLPVFGQSGRPAQSRLELTPSQHLAGGHVEMTQPAPCHSVHFAGVNPEQVH